jgi:RNA polymerase sigma-70 factor, ECF subfamily
MPHGCVLRTRLIKDRALKPRHFLLIMGTEVMNASDRTTEFVGMFAAHDRGIYKYILTLVAAPATAQEIFQETSVVLWQKYDEFETGSNFFAWACRIAYFEVLKHRQAHRRDKLCFNDALLETIAVERTEAEDALQARRLVLPGCMQKLRPADRELVERRYAGSCSMQEVAEKMHRPLNTIYKALERIRRTLMKCIETTMAH